MAPGQATVKLRQSQAQVVHMKRRDFLARSAGLACAVLPGIALAKPCPPTVLGGSGSSGLLCPQGDAEADWLHRISDEGVVWYHDFRSAAEVDMFRWTLGTGQDLENEGSDSRHRDTAIWVPDDGITGGSMEVRRFPGSTESQTWWRPFSPMRAPGNGRDTDDPGANGTIAAQTWSPVQGKNLTASWTKGYYVHPSYESQYPGQIDGNEFWLQMRIKQDPEVYWSDGGKMLFFTRTDRSLTSQEIVVNSGFVQSGKNLFRMYRSGGSSLLTDVANEGHQPGSEYTQNVGNGICNWRNQNGGHIDNCWIWQPQWDTYMWHIIPGTSADPNTTIEVYAARYGATEFTKIWSQDDVPMPYDDPNGMAKGYGAAIMSNYQNGFERTIELNVRYCQVIFSKSFIPCPQV
jgi:hypothetical protein